MRLIQVKSLAGPYAVADDATFGRVTELLGIYYLGQAALQIDSEICDRR